MNDKKMVEDTHIVNRLIDKAEIKKLNKEILFQYLMNACIFFTIAGCVEDDSKRLGCNVLGGIFTILYVLKVILND